MLIDPTQLALQAAMSGAGMRQEALANNLANANTPGYQRKDVDFHGQLAAAMGSGDPAGSLAAMRFAARTDGAGATRADGSTVDVDAESAKLAQNGLEYEQLSTAMRTRIDILKIAMGVSQ
jgi:flagellar basal-body rod protein FlgB